MKKATWNPTRRNRNIGTAKSGRSADNKLVVPDRWTDDRIFWEKLNNPVVCPIKIGSHTITLFVEPPRAGSIHASTPQDVIKVLSLIPAEHLEEIDILVFRQPSRKAEILSSVWGRYVYWSDLGKYAGPGIHLEAIEVNAVIDWHSRITPFQQKELEALESDGHRIEKNKRGFKILTTPESVRGTQLFRTLPHEIGHAVDYLTNSLLPSLSAKTEAESEYISDAFRAKPSKDKEEFANRYARNIYCF